MRDGVAWWFRFLRRESTRESNEQGNPAGVVTLERSQHDHTVAMIKKMPFPLYNREFVGRMICATDANGDILIASVPVNDTVDYGLSTRTVRGVTRSFFRVASSSESRCRVTYCLYLDAGGRIPTWVVDAKLPLALSGINRLRDAFQRDDEIDKVARDELASCICDSPQIYTAEEDALINEVHVKLGTLEWKRFDVLESPDHLIRMGKIFLDNDTRVVMRGSVVVDAPIEVCAAWEMAKTSRKNVVDGRARGTLESRMTIKSEHYHLFHLVKDLHIPNECKRRRKTPESEVRASTDGKRLVVRRA